MAPADASDAQAAAVTQYYRENPEHPILAALQDGGLVGFIELRLVAAAAAEIWQIAGHIQSRRNRSAG